MEDLLARAQEAERIVASHTDPLLQEQWREIANAYRNLAQIRSATLQEKSEK